MATGAVGRSPGVRPVLEPVLARRSGEGVGEKDDRGSGAVWAGEAAVVFWGEEAAEVVVAGMVTGGSQGGKGRENTGGDHTNGGRRMVSYMHGRTTGGYRVTVVMYRVTVVMYRGRLSWRRGLHR